MANIIRVVGNITTIGLQTVTIVSYAMPNNSSCQCHIKIVGKDLITGLACSFSKIVTFKCFASVAVVVGGTNVISPHKDSGLGAVAIIEAVTGPNAQFTVTGVAGKTIVWSARMDVDFN